MGLRERLTSDESPFVSTPAVKKQQRSITIQYVGELCWILSETTWTLLYPPLCIPFGAGAFIFLLWSAILDIQCSERFEWWFPPVLQVLWLITNLVWMMDELLVDSPDQQTPWALTPLTGREDDDMYEYVQSYCILGFYAVPVLWLLAIALVSRPSWMLIEDGDPCCRDSARKHPARVLFTQAGHIAMWALLDGLWASEFFWSSIAVAVMTIVMFIVGAAAETKLGLRGIDRTDMVWIVWTLSNMVWVACELAYDDDLQLRYAAGILGFVALFVLLVSYEQVKSRTRLRASQVFEVDICHA
eukprot:TRINITY_DN73830_c0_g1_i1.p1 TRINITY_DN73830_c0_g1~~TRINITY_DN73830_c0_g1_i1.p1  ORF type:complete len:314 (-),score=52.03 TRINITY_DN73830_c0_g1_i1:293-1195(-)